VLDGVILQKKALRTSGKVNMGQTGLVTGDWGGQRQPYGSTGLTIMPVPQGTNRKDKIR